MIRTLLLTTSLCSAFFLQAQQTGKEYVPALVGFYNLENLFDTLDSPDTDDREFLPDAAKRWTAERYATKLEHMSRVIADIGTDIHPHGLAVIGLAEVENGSVMEDLASTPALRGRGYRVASHEGPDRRGVDVGFMYDPARFELLSQSGHRLSLPNDTSFRTRDQLLMTGVMDGDTIHFMVAHWPSRRGGEKRSKPFRAAAGDLGRRVVDSLLAADPDARIVYMGDLNDDPVDPSVRRHLRTTAKPELAHDGFLFNPMEELYNKGVGTGAWRDTWNLFDQIIISPALVTGQGGRYKYYAARVYNRPYLQQTEGSFAGYPLRSFVGDVWQGGYSDHFPVFLVLVREK